jgi:hypothetical protein
MENKGYYCLGDQLQGLQILPRMSEKNQAGVNIIQWQEEDI